MRLTGALRPESDFDALARRDGEFERRNAPRSQRGVQFDGQVHPRLSGARVVNHEGVGRPGSGTCNPEWEQPLLGGPGRAAVQRYAGKPQVAVEALEHRCQQVAAAGHHGERHLLPPGDLTAEVEHRQRVRRNHDTLVRHRFAATLVRDEREVHNRGVGERIQQHETRSGVASRAGGGEVPRGRYLGHARAGVGGTIEGDLLRHDAPGALQPHLCGHEHLCEIDQLRRDLGDRCARIDGKLRVRPHGNLDARRRPLLGLAAQRHGREEAHRAAQLVPGGIDNDDALAGSSRAPHSADTEPGAATRPAVAGPHQPCVRGRHHVGPFRRQPVGHHERRQRGCESEDRRPAHVRAPRARATSGQRPDPRQIRA